MRPRSLPRFLLVLALCAAGCSRDKPQEAPLHAPNESAPASPGGLRPLSSRDGAKPFVSPDAAPSEPLPAGHPPIDSGIAGKAVSGTVSIAPAFQARTSPTDVLYLIARSRRTKAVVAVRREEGIRFPHSFELSSADVMVADQPFAGPFDITARLSKTGDALPARGDLEGAAAEVAEGARTVSVVIDRVRE